MEALAALVARLEAVAARLEGAGGSAGTADNSGAGAETAPSVVAFDQLTEERLAPWTKLSATIGGDVAAAGDIVKNGFAEVRKLLVVAAQSKEPKQEDFVKLLAPLGKVLDSAGQLKSKRGPQANQTAMVAETLNALTWVTIKPTPGPFVKEGIDAGEFYGNKVRMEFKGKDQNQIDWVAGFKSLFEGLQEYVRKTHTTGLVWNAKGGDALAASTGAAPAAPAPPKGPGGPPPPPPPSAPLVPPAGAPAAAAGGENKPNTAALFSELSRGDAVTSHLKKVTRDMTNKDKKVDSLVTADALPKKAAPTYGAAAAKVEKEYPPVLVLDGNKWRVEHQKGNKNVVVDITSPKQVVYLYKCKDSFVKINGKCNNVTVDSCTKTAMMLDDVMASVEIVAAKSFEMQCNGKIPNISIDNTDGCQIYWENSANNDCEVISSKSSEINISLKKNGEDMPTEFPLPHQYLSKFDGKTFHTEPISHNFG